MADYELWKSRVATMRTYMSDVANRKKWLNIQKFYYGDYKGALGLKIPPIVINGVYEFVKVAIANLFARSPKFKCNPTPKGKFINSKILEQVLNYYWYVKKVKRQMKKAIKDAKLFGYSFLKVGYNADIGVEDSTGNEYIAEDDVFCVFVKHDAIWYDPQALDPPFDCSWMDHHYLIPTDKANERWDKDIKPTDEVDYLMKGKKHNLLKPQDREMTRIHEIWDIESRKVLYYTEGCDGFLEEKEWPYDMKGFPFVMLNFDELTDLHKIDNVPDPEVNFFIDTILEKIKLRSMQMNHIKRFARQMICDKDCLDEDSKENYKKGVDGAIIGADCQGRPLDQVLKPIAYPPIQADIYAVENRIDMDNMKISGQQGGGPVPTKSKTLGEVQEVTQVSDARTLEQQDIVEEFAEEAARKIVALVQQFYDGERYARIVGEVSPIEKMVFEQAGVLDGVSVKYTKEQIQGEYDIEIVHGSTLPIDPRKRLNDLIQIARFGQAFGLTPNDLTPKYLGKAVMEEMELYDVSKAYDKDVEKALKPQEPSPMDKMKMIDAKTKIDNRVNDTKLKQTRIEGNNISNVSKAAKASADMKGEENKDNQK